MYINPGEVVMVDLRSEHSKQSLARALLFLRFIFLGSFLGSQTNFFQCFGLILQQVEHFLLPELDIIIDESLCFTVKVFGSFLVEDHDMHDAQCNCLCARERVGGI